jgi:hypothetical protein
MKLRQTRTRLLSRFLPLLLASVLLGGCAPYVRSQLQSGFSVQEVGKGGTAVMVTTEPTLLEFRKSYASAFGTGDSLSRAVSNRIAGHLGAGSRAVAMDDRAAAALATLKDTTQAERNAAFLKGLGSRYLLHVNGIVIDEKSISTPQGNALNCIILYKADVWDTESGLKRASFEVDGDAGVLFLAFEAALLTAINETSDRLAAYLNTGKMGP